MTIKEINKVVFTNENGLFVVNNLTAKEFSPLDFICEPSTQSMIKKIEVLENNYEEKRKIALKFGNKYKKLSLATYLGLGLISIIFIDIYIK